MGLRETAIWKSKRGRAHAARPLRAARRDIAQTCYSTTLQKQALTATPADAAQPGVLLPCSCRGIVDDHRRLIIRDLRRAAVSLPDRVLPGWRVEAVRGFAALPQIDTAAHVILTEQVVLADQARDLFVVGRRLVVDHLRVVERHALGQREADDGSDHWRCSVPRSCTATEAVHSGTMLRCSKPT